MVRRLTHVISRLLDGYVVYELVDPQDGRIFYIGCGSGYRWYSTTMPSAARQTPEKHQRLVSIREAGKRVIFRVVAKFRSSECAFAFERMHQQETFGSVRSCCGDMVACRGVAEAGIVYNDRVVIIDRTNGYYYDDGWGPKQRSKIVMTSPPPTRAKAKLKRDLENDDDYYDDDLDLAGLERAARERGWTP